MDSAAAVIAVTDAEVVPPLEEDARAVRFVRIASWKAVISVSSFRKLLRASSISKSVLGKRPRQTLGPFRACWASRNAAFCQSGADRSLAGRRCLNFHRVPLFTRTTSFFFFNALAIFLRMWIVFVTIHHKIVVDVIIRRHVACCGLLVAISKAISNLQFAKTRHWGK